MTTKSILLLVLTGNLLSSGLLAQPAAESARKSGSSGKVVQDRQGLSLEALLLIDKTDAEYTERMRLHPEQRPNYAPLKARNEGNFKEAERLFKLVKPAAFSDYTQAQYNLAQFYDWQGKYQLAIKAYQNLQPTPKSSSSWGTDPESIYGYASVTARSGNWIQAVKIYEYGLQKYLDTMGDSNMKTIVHFDPEVVETDHLVAWTDYLRGRGASNGPDYESEERLRHLKRAVKLKPNFVAAQECLGENMLGYPETAREGKIHYTWAAKYADTQAEKERLLQKAGLLVSVGETNVISVNRKVTVTERLYFIRKRDPELEAILNKP